MTELDSHATARRSLMLLWALSGFSVLTLEMVWMREIARWAGDTAVAATLVTAVFFVFAALGNLWGARWIGGVRHPLAWYGRFEVLAGAAAVVAFAACRWLWMHPDAVAQSWSSQMMAAIVLAGPSSFFSGVAFPSLAETFVTDAKNRTADGAPFYGCNLLGAASGVAAGGVMLPLWLGLTGAFSLAAALQIAGGWLAGLIAKRIPLTTRNPVSPSSLAAVTPWTGRALLVASGLLSLGVQSLLLVWVRQAFEGSVYAATGVLFAFIGGLGAGALAASGLRRQGRDTRGLLAGFACGGALMLFLLPMLGSALSVRDLALTSDAPGGLLVEALFKCSLVLLPPSFCLGGVFPLAWELAGAPSKGEGSLLGTALAVNKLGAAAGTAAGLFLLLPLAGLTRGLHVMAWAYLGIAVLVKRRRLLWPGFVALLGLWPTLSQPRVPGVTAELRIVAADAGAYGPVTVVEDIQSDSRQILLNSRQRLSGTKQSLSSQRHQSWVPLLFCSEPRRVITIGMAAGISAAAALDFPIRELEAVELVPEVVRAAHDYFADWNRALFTDPRSRVITGDGRIELARSAERYDAIICDLFFPAEEGTARLYSRDFLAQALGRLDEGGVFCLWLPCYQLTPQTAGVVVRTFLDVFPNAVAVRANLDPLQPVIGLLGSASPLPVSREHFARRLAVPEIAALAAQSPFLRSPDHAMLLLAGDLRTAEPGFESHPLTTDDRPLFAFMGPRQPQGRERLFGFPFLDWIGKRFPKEQFPSCDIAATAPQYVLGAVRAGNFYMAAAASNVVLPGDSRSGDVRTRQVEQLLDRARGLAPAASLNLADLGR